jgi:xanthine dehydrogenase/oxidase
MGQGIHTKMAQVAAQTLGVSLDQITVGDSSTETCANTNPSAASVTADINGYAIVDACEQILRRMSPVRESLSSQGKPASFKDVAFECWFRRVDLSAHGFYRTPDVGFDWSVSKGRPFHYFSFGAAVSEVEVDVLTGDMHILRADMTHDVGKSLNPAVDIGQIEGAFMQVDYLIDIVVLFKIFDTLQPGSWTILPGGNGMEGRWKFVHEGSVHIQDTIFQRHSY